MQMEEEIDMRETIEIAQSLCVFVIDVNVAFDALCG